MRLAQDLYDVYGQKIVERDRVIDPKFVRELIKKGKNLPRKIVRVRDTGMLRDFEKALHDRRYRGLFKSPTIKKHLISVFSRVTFSEPLFQELRHMKSHLPETYHHVLTMAALVIKMIRDMKSIDYDPVLAASVCMTHDIGKTRIPKRILDKKSPLTEEQYRIIKTHPVIGYLLLSYYSAGNGRLCRETAFQHHEKLDGTGYPRGIKRINRYAQLIAPIDIYDALISKRPYRQMSYNGRLALDILLEDAKNKKLNVKSIYLLINCLRAKKAKSLSRFKVSQRRRGILPTGNSYGKVKRNAARRLLRKD